MLGILCVDDPTQASVYLNRAALWVLPDAMYGKYVHGPNPIFTHLYGSSWHGEDAKSVLWFVRHPLFFVIFGVIAVSGLVLYGLTAWRVKARLKALVQQPKYTPLVEISTFKTS